MTEMESLITANVSSGLKVIVLFLCEGCMFVHVHMCLHVCIGVNLLNMCMYLYGWGYVCVFY